MSHLETRSTVLAWAAYAEAPARGCLRRRTIDGCRR